MGTTIIKVLVSATIIFLVIVSVRKLFRGKVGNGFIYSMWLVFALDLLASGVYLAGQDAFGWNLYQIKSPLSVMNLMDIFPETRQNQNSLPDNAENHVNPVEDMTDRPDENFVPKDKNEDAEISNKGNSLSEQGERHLAAGMAKPSEGIFRQWNRNSILFGIWIAGVAILLITQISLEKRFRRKLVWNREETDYRGQKIYITKGIATPLLFRSKGIALDIYIPEMVMDDENVVKHAVLHENTHRKHGDIWWSYLRNFLVAVYWFYPPAWIAAVLSKRDCEFACDSSLMRGMNKKEKIDYGNSLLSLVEVGKKENVFSTATAMKIGKNEMEVRIRMIKNGIQKKKVVAIFVCLLLCGACIVAYTDAQNGSKSEEIKSEEKKVAEEKLAATPETSEEGNNIPVREAEYKITDIWGADDPQIYYEDDSRMIFAGYFGLFVYSKAGQQIVQSLDLKYIGCNYTQGDKYCDIQVSADGTQVYLHINNDTTLYHYSVDTNQLQHVKYYLPKELYHRDDGNKEEQGRLCVGAGTIGDLSYEYADANGEYMHRVPLFYAPYEPYASCEFFGPKDMHDICEVSFYMCGKEYVIKDVKKLKWIEEHFQSPTEEIKGGAGCPFYHVMYLKRDDGTCGKIYPATDSCAVFGTHGEGTDEYAYYEYDEGTNDTFWKLFGIDSIDKASVGEIEDVELPEEVESMMQSKVEIIRKNMGQLDNEAKKELNNTDK